METIRNLTQKRSLIFIVGKSDQEFPQTEYWYGTKYDSRKIYEHEINNWEGYSDLSLKFPPPNTYLTTNLNLVVKQNKDTKPTLVLNEGGLKVW